MTELLTAIQNLQLDSKTKGFPMVGGSIRLGDIGAKNWSVPRGDLMLPALIIRDANLHNNLDTMRRFAEHHGVSLAPHGKSSFSPQLYREQIDIGGAWGISAATVQQATLVAEAGVPNVLIVNEVVGRANIEQLVSLRHAHPEKRFFSLVDSDAALEQLAKHGASLLLPEERFQILLEVGFPGGRAGVRTREQGAALLKSIGRRATQFELVGVECYEGLVTRDTPEATITEVDRLLDLTVDLYQSARDNAAFTRSGEGILTAGGSAYYDRVIERFRLANLGPDTRIVLRGGSSLTYDHGFYDHYLELMDSRAGLQMPEGRLSARTTFTPALELWAAVVTLQDPGVAVVGMGIRDLPYDLGYPKPLRQYRDGNAIQNLNDGGGAFKIVNSNDQHCYLTYPEGADIQVGDLIAFGISHPCTAFDKWSIVYRVDEDLTVTGAVKTFF
ncbi:MAG: alanine racemase [Variovorax sp.]